MLVLCCCRLALSALVAAKPRADKLILFSALFEVYPEVVIGSLSQEKIQRPVVTLGDADVDKTLEVLQKQRRSFESVSRVAAEGDQVKFDFHGTVEGNRFPGGEGQDFNAVIGEGRLLKEFEQNLIGIKAGETKSFEVSFPDNYPATELVGKAKTLRSKSDGRWRCANGYRRETTPAEPLF